MALWKIRGKGRNPGDKDYYSTFTGKLNRIYDCYYGVVRTDDRQEPQASKVLRENHGAEPYDPSIHGQIPQVVRQLDPLEAAIQGQTAQRVREAQERADDISARMPPGALPVSTVSLDQLEAGGDGSIPTRPAVTLAE